MACIQYFTEKRFAVEALFVEYGQPGLRFERTAARAVARHWKTPLSIVRVEPLNVTQGVIPGRNALLAFIGLISFPRTHGIISLGIHAGTTYADCSPGFVMQAQAMFDLYSDGRLRLDAPFLEWSKQEIYKYSIQHRLPIALTRSCEADARLPCGKCNSCRDIEALNAG